ncbi:MAG: uL14 family ribosomal protein [archaeon]
MKAISTRPTKGIKIGTRLNCIDNTGAKVIQVIAVRGFKGTRRRVPQASIGNVVICAVKKGNQKIMHEVVKAIIVRQKKAYLRPNGMHIKFDDNAAVLVDDKLEPRGKDVKGAIAKEVVERFPTIGKISKIII